MLDIIGGHFADELVTAVSGGKKIQGTGLGHETTNTTNPNTGLHYFASNLVVERVPCGNLSSVSPQLEISSYQNKAFLLDSNDGKKLRDDMKVLVGRILIQKTQNLSFFKQAIPKYIAHQYQNEMSEKSVIEQ